MARWSIILAIACATYAALSFYDGGMHRKAIRVVADSEIVNWQPAAMRDPEENRAADAFQRAWNSSERRVDQMLPEAEPKAKR